MIFRIQSIETIENSSDNKDSMQWPKSLSSFQITCLSTVNNKFSYHVGTILQLEPEMKRNSSHRKAQVLIRGKNEEFPARCRVYQQEGANENQRVPFSFVYFSSATLVELMRRLGMIWQFFWTYI